MSPTTSLLQYNNTMKVTVGLNSMTHTVISNQGPKESVLALWLLGIRASSLNERFIWNIQPYHMVTGSAYLLGKAGKSSIEWYILVIYCCSTNHPSNLVP